MSRALSQFLGLLALALLLAACAGSNAADVQPTGPAEGEDDLDFVARMLGCTPAAGNACGTIPDSLVAVEDAHPLVEVVSVEREAGSLSALVLRHPGRLEDGVYFRYDLDETGRIRARTCLNGIPREGSSLARYGRVDGREGERVVFNDRCTIRGACRRQVARRVSFRVDERGELVEPLEVPGLSGDGSSSMECLYLPGEVPLPSGPARINRIEGGAFLARPAAEPQRLAVGALVEGKKLLLAPGTRIAVEIAGISVLFAADDDRGLELQLIQDPRLGPAWMKVRRSLEAKRQGGREDHALWPAGTESAWSRREVKVISLEGAVVWATPFLFDGAELYRVDGEDPERAVCRALIRNVQCSTDCGGFRSGMRSFHDPDHGFLLIGPGPVLSGTCM